MRAEWRMTRVQHVGRAERSAVRAVLAANRFAESVVYSLWLRWWTVCSGALLRPALSLDRCLR
eukprot:2211280-Pleurochrysis_carterae.AAC.1